MKNGRRDRLTSTVGYVITMVWAASFLADVIVTNYNPPWPYVSPLMLIVAGALFRDGIVSKKRGNSDSG